MVDNTTINELCSKVDLLEYASEMYDFERRTRDSYVTNCPLHTDVTPSLSINPTENYFHCFSCGVGGNLLSWMMKIENLSYTTAIEKISKITGVDVIHTKQCSAIQFYKQVKSAVENHNEGVFSLENTKRENLDYMGKYANRFSAKFPEIWINEGISVESMKKYDIRVDEVFNRIVYPVFDANGRFIGVKGRTMNEHYKELRIPKYNNYYKIGTTDFLQGYDKLTSDVIAEGKIIIFEGLKSVLKAYGWGYKNTVSAETSVLTPSQCKILLNAGFSDITIAFDEDVNPQKIRDCTSLLRKFTNVYMVLDRKNPAEKLLSTKDAPVDKGKEVFETLLKERVRV